MTGTPCILLLTLSTTLTPIVGLHGGPDNAVMADAVTQRRRFDDGREGYRPTVGHG
jgi:hypothetical protein